MSEIKYNMKITIKAICRYEAMSNLSFFSFSTSPSVEQILIMLYAILISHKENNVNCSFQDFIANTNQNTIKTLSDALENELEITNQFMPSFILDEEEKAASEDSSTLIEKIKNIENPVYVTELVPMLIYDCGLDANFVYNEFEINQLEVFLKYRENREKGEMVEKRFWTYLMISPHINTKKCKSPEALLPFEWEKKEKKKSETKKLDNMADRLRELGILNNNDTSTNENGEN